MLLSWKTSLCAIFSLFGVILCLFGSSDAATNAGVSLIGSATTIGLILAQDAGKGRRRTRREEEEEEHDPPTPKRLKPPVPLDVQHDRCQPPL